MQLIETSLKTKQCFQGIVFNFHVNTYEMHCVSAKQKVIS